MTKRTDMGWWLPVCTALAWLGLALSQFFALWLYDALWLLGYLIAEYLAWLPAMVLSVVLVVRLSVRRRWWAVGAAVAVLLSAGAAVWTAPLPGLFIRTYYAANEDGFAEVARMAEAHELDLADYYGDELPEALRHLSVTGKAAPLSTESGSESGSGSGAGVFLPRWVGLTQGAVGYAYLPRPPAEGEIFDGFGDGVHACRFLGDGWYWVTRKGGEC